MKRNSRRLSGWIILAMIALSVGMIGAGERVPPEGPLALLYDQIHALFVETGLLAAESDDQQAKIDQLTSTVCGLSALTDNPAPRELCEVVVTEACDFDESAVCDCDPGDDFKLESCEPVELESCESASFPHPDFGVVPPPKCEMVNGCRGTFTRTAVGDVGNIKVDPNCETEDPGPSGGRDCDRCPCGCITSDICDIRPC